MSDQQILEKAIQKAIEGGWQVPSYDMQKIKKSPAWVMVDEGWSTRDVIFNHDFAKALWGTEMISTFPWAEDGSYKCETQAEAWIHHIQQMVIAEDPIKYLGENI